MNKRSDRWNAYVGFSVFIALHIYTRDDSSQGNEYIQCRHVFMFPTPQLFMHCTQSILFLDASLMLQRDRVFFHHGIPKVVKVSD